MTEEGPDFTALLRLALQAGLTVQAYWDLTPVETYLVIDAAIWRVEQAQRRDLVLAWRTAAFSRAKRLPPLRQLLNTGPAKPLRGKELLKRRAEFADMKKALERSGLNKPRTGDGS